MLLTRSWLILKALTVPLLIVDPALDDIQVRNVVCIETCLETASRLFLCKELFATLEKKILITLYPLTMSACHVRRPASV